MTISCRPPDAASVPMTERPDFDRRRAPSVCVIVSLFHSLYARSWALARPTTTVHSMYSQTVATTNSERTEYVEVYEKGVPRYDDRHRVKSGITGWAQSVDSAAGFAEQSFNALGKTWLHLSMKPAHRHRARAR